MESLVIRCVIVILLGIAAYKYQALCRQPDLNDVDEAWLAWHGGWTGLLGSMVAYGAMYSGLSLVLSEPWLPAFFGPAVVLVTVFRMRASQQARRRELERRLEQHRRWHERMGMTPWPGDDDDDV